MHRYDITLLTDARYVVPKPGDWYVENIFLDDDILRQALEKRGLKVHRTHWDNPDFDWSETRFAMFRTTWDYFDRFAEFSSWLEATAVKTSFINPLPLIRWNMDKHYLADLQALGVRIPPTVFVERGDTRSLLALMETAGWQECVLKPAVGGAGRHTYRVDADSLAVYEPIFKDLIAEEAMLLQEFMVNVPLKGEVTLMLMGGKFTHAVLKMAKAGDFRVQDDFGGTVYDYSPPTELIGYAEELMRACSPMPVYARVDVIWDNEGHPCVSELELIEPELWLRKFPEAAELLADGILRMMEAMQ